MHPGYVRSHNFRCFLNDRAGTAMSWQPRSRAYPAPLAAVERQLHLAHPFETRRTWAGVGQAVGDAVSPAALFPPCSADSLVGMRFIGDRSRDMKNKELRRQVMLQDGRGQQKRKHPEAAAVSQ